MESPVPRTFILETDRRRYLTIPTRPQSMNLGQICLIAERSPLPVPYARESGYSDGEASLSASFNFSPAFYDSLSQIWLTEGALQEFNRRDALCPAPEPDESVDSNSQNLEQFARDGGPDLLNLRGASINYTGKLDTVSNIFLVSPTNRSRSLRGNKCLHLLPI